MNAPQRQPGIQISLPQTGRRKSGAQPKPLRFLRVPHPHMRQPCILIISHARNKKGYVPLRPRDGSRGHHVNAHRLAYVSKYGPASLPYGWECDHICGRRACANRSHLRAIPRSDHKAVTNAARSGARIEAARCQWEAHGRPSSRALARLFDVAQTTAARWIRLWVAEEAAA